MGSNDSDLAAAPQHELSLGGFFVSRYPITNAQYYPFVLGGGYRERKYWTPEGWAWRLGQGDPNLLVFGDPDLRQYWREVCARRSVADRARPFVSRESLLGLANRPVVGVSWYEAVAYCRWLTEVLGFGEMAPGQAASNDRGVVSLWQDGVKACLLLTPEDYLRSQGSEDCAQYEIGLSSLVWLLEQRGRDYLQEGLALQRSLTENLALMAKGDRSEWRDARVQIVDQLDRLAGRVLGLSFKDLCVVTKPILAGVQWVIDLPSEAQWEKAARGRHGVKWPWEEGDASGSGGAQGGEGGRGPGESSGEHGGGDRPCWLWANTMEAGIGTTCAVGCFPKGASKYGCLDMIGNVWEWTRSKWGGQDYPPDYRYPYSEADGREHLSGTELRVIRGGSWANTAGQAVCSTRWRSLPDRASGFLGFRVVLHRPYWGPVLWRALVAGLPDRAKEMEPLRHIQDYVRQGELEEALTKLQGVEGADEIGAALNRKWHHLCREERLRGKDEVAFKDLREQVGKSVLDHTTARLHILAEPEAPKKACRVLVLCPGEVPEARRSRLEEEVRQVQEVLLSAQGPLFEIQQRWEIGESGMESALSDGPQIVHFPAYACPDGWVEDAASSRIGERSALLPQLAGVLHLLFCLPKDHHVYADALTYYDELRENLSRLGRQHDVGQVQKELARIVACLDRLAMEALGESFDELCGLGWPLTLHGVHRALHRLQQHDVRCIVLDGLRAPGEQARLLAEHVDCSVSIPLQVEEEAATRFVINFYRALADGASVRQAFDTSWGQDDWTTYGTGPQLYEHHTGAAARFVPSVATAAVRSTAARSPTDQRGMLVQPFPWAGTATGDAPQPPIHPRSAGSQRVWVICDEVRDKVEQGGLDEALQDMYGVGIGDYRLAVRRKMRVLLLKWHVIVCAVRQRRRALPTAKAQVAALAEELRQLLGGT